MSEQFKIEITPEMIEAGAGETKDGYKSRDTKRWQPPPQVRPY